MDALGLVTLAALGLALLLHAAFLVLAGTASGQRALAYPALVVATASLLAWQGLVALTWLPGVVLVLLVGGAAASLVARGTPLPPPRLTRLEWGLLAILALGAVCAAFPFYRPDQWNNDLILAKAVADGPLRTPIFEEHVFYGGNYQYLFTLPRWLWRDDVFNHSAADAFSWLLLAFGLAGLVARWRSAALTRLPPVLLLLCWAMFAIPDRTAIANAKPDPLLMLCALALLELSAGPAPGDSRRLHGFLSGFLLVAPLGLKLTWAHFGASACVAWLALVALRRPIPWPSPGPFAAGSLTGLGTLAPYLLTNLRFFGNPLHPAQAGPLRSSYWNEDFARYYADVAGRADSVAGYASSLWHLVPMRSFHLYYLLLPVLLVAVAAAATRGPAPARPDAHRTLLLRHALAVTIGFVLLWPLFFGYGVFPRYVYSGLAMVIALLVCALDRLVDWGEDSAQGRWRRRLAAAALLVPAVFAGGLTDELPLVARFAAADRDRFAREGPPEWRLAQDLLLINAHRRTASPDAAFHARTTLMDMAGGYLLDGVAFQGGREYRWLERHLGGGSRPACPWTMLERLDVAYVRARSGFGTWPRAYQAAVGMLPAIEPSGRIRYVAPGVAARQAAADPECHS